MGSNGSIGVLNRGPKKGSKIIMNLIGWPLNPGSWVLFALLLMTADDMTEKGNNVDVI